MEYMTCAVPTRTSVVNATKLSSSPTTSNLHIKYLSRRNVLFHSNDMPEVAQLLDDNTLHNDHVVEELIIVSNA